MVVYPHRVSVVRVVDDAQEDELGRPLAASETMRTETAWVQKRRAEEIVQLSEQGITIGDYKVFMYPNDVVEGDYLVTQAGGGLLAGTTHRILGVRDPDGTGHHLELDTRVVSGVGA